MKCPSTLANEVSTIRTSGSDPIFVMDDLAITLPMLNSTPETAVRQIQREDASLSSLKLHPCSARNLLLGVFKKGWERPPTVEKLKKEHAKLLLKTPIGRDLNLITAAGVEYKVHSIMLIGGSKMLQDGLFPGDALHPDPPKYVNLPANFHPILMDRVVNFIYTSDYTFDPSSSKNITQLTNENFNFHNSTFVPPIIPPTPATVALAGIRDSMFHLHMYSLGEELQYPSLKSTAHAKLVETLVRQRGRNPSIFKDPIDAVFSAPGSSTRICMDEDGTLQQLLVAAVIAHESKSWGEHHRADFHSLLQGPEYTDFWTAYHAVKNENAELIKAGDVAKELGEKRSRAKKERQLAKKGGSGIGVGTTGSPLKNGIMAAGTRAVGGNRPRDRFKRMHVPREKAGRVEKEDDNMEMEMEMD